MMRERPNFQVSQDRDGSWHAWDDGGKRIQGWPLVALLARAQRDVMESLRTEGQAEIAKARENERFSSGPACPWRHSSRSGLLPPRVAGH